MNISRKTLVVLAVAVTVLAAGCAAEVDAPEAVGTSDDALAGVIVGPLLIAEKVANGVPRCDACNGVPRCDNCARVLGGRAIVQLDARFAPSGTYLLESPLGAFRVTTPARAFTAALPTRLPEGAYLDVRLAR